MRSPSLLYGGDVVGYELSGRLLDVRERRTQDGRLFGVAEVLCEDDRGHRVVPVYVDNPQVQWVLEQVQQEVRWPVRVYVSNGSLRTVLQNGG